MSAYFDYAATTPLDPAVLQVMLPFFSDEYGNPSSIHHAGQRAEAAIEESRARVASLLNATPEEITFTGGATESNNLAIRSIARRRREDHGYTRIVTTPVEHPSVLQTCRDLESAEGFELELLPIDSTGRVLTDQLEDHLEDGTALVSVVYANNEIGTINPIEMIGRVCHARRIPLHIDSAQAANHLDLDVDKLKVDAMTLGAHKFYGPKGVGVLYHRKGLLLSPIQTGGSQEFGTRAGTHNVPSIVGFAESFEKARALQLELTPRLTSLRDRIIDTIPREVPDTILTGHRSHRLANHASFAIHGVDSNQLLAALDVSGFACSSGSACKTGNPEPSAILMALGLEPDWALGALRITLGRGTTDAQVEDLLRILPDIVARLRSSQNS